MVKTHCLNCQADIPLGVDPKIGQMVTCPACQSSFEVVWLFPLELDWFSESESFTDNKDSRRSPRTLSE
jgi:lysine biosynthesis protein LysW